MCVWLCVPAQLADEVCRPLGDSLGEVQRLDAPQDEGVGDHLVCTAEWGAGGVRQEECVMRLAVDAPIKNYRDLKIMGSNNI